MERRDQRVAFVPQTAIWDPGMGPGTSCHRPQSGATAGIASARSLRPRPLFQLVPLLQLRFWPFSGDQFLEQPDEASENDLIAEYMLNKRPTHVFMRCVPNQSFVCCSATSVDVLVGEGGGGGGGDFNFIYAGVCGHRIGKLTHPQTKGGPSVNKTDPFSDYLQ